jgi:GMP synthase-like glutamine amidotransferase
MLNHLSIAVIDCGSKKLDAICSLVKELGCSLEKIPLDGAKSTEFKAFQAAIISGGPLRFTDPGKTPHLEERFEFISRLPMPTLGICLGHQALGLRHGAMVFRGPEIRRPEKIELLHPHPLFEGIASGTLFGEDHCEGITLPERFTLLASSASYAVEAMAAEDKPFFYGVQFHPEISGEPGRKIFQNFIALITSGSLSQPARAAIGKPE